ncbi:MAG: TonB-dependent receptor, partial [Burkholderiaceae bacterium]|nr:TonB-dependent receptor [Burkholderiaceae bacterium]
GSNIRRADAETPSPVQVISSDDLKKSGYTTVSQVLENLTSNGQGNLSSGFPGAFAGGATGISLRGLTTAATLVLIDGHRMAPYPLSDDGQRSFVDISSIPFDAVERIEVLKDGASAVYGSDAMAGVVNIILKKNFTGTQVAAEGGTTTEGGGTTYHASVTHGWGDYNEDGYNAYVSLEFRHQGDITQKDRQGTGQWSRLDQTNIGGNNQTPGASTNQGGIRATPPTYGTVYLTPLSGKFTAANSVFYPSTVINSNSAYKGNCTYDLLMQGGCTYVNPHAEIQPATQNVNLIASFDKKLQNDWKLDVKASIFDSKGEQYNAGSQANGLTLFSTAYQPLVAVSAGVAPHLVGSAFSVTVPGNYPGNTLGVPARVRGVNLDAPIAHTEFDAKSYRLVGDLSGSIGAWDIDASLGYTRVNTSFTDYGATNVAALQAALNRATNPYSITGGNSAADNAAIYPVEGATDSSTLEFAELHVSRSLMQLAGGDMGFSTGGSFIHRNLDAVAPPLVAEGIVSGNNAYAQGSQSDTSLYAELYAPVLKTLELDGHVRFDHFDNAGNATTPSVGFKYTPIPEFALRGTYGRGFRAPNSAENGQAGQGYSAGTGADPILCPHGASAAGAVISACNYNVVYLNSANPKLNSEKSTSETLGVILEPIKGWSTTFDAYQVEIRDQIVAGTGDASNAVRGSVLPDTCSDGNGGVVACTPSAGPILYIPVEYVNANSTKVSGWELDSRYKFKMGEWGSLTADINWSHMMSYIFTTSGTSYQLAGTHGPAVIGGNTGNPKDRIQTTFTWDKGPLQIATTFNYISSFSLTDPSGSNAGTPVLDCAAGVQQGGYYAAWFPGNTGYPGASATPTQSQYCKVGYFLDTDLSVSYKIGKQWVIHGAVTNLFNQAPPLDLNTYGGGNLPYNPSMHMGGAVGRFMNIGASYKF